MFMHVIKMSIKQSVEPIKIALMFINIVDQIHCFKH